MSVFKANWPIILAIVIAALFISIALVLPGGVFAQDTGGLVPCSGDDCDFCSLAQLGQRIINLAIFLAVFLSAILFAWAGWNYLTNFGDTGKVAKAHEVFRNVAVGFIIILAAWLIIDTLMKTLLGGHFGPWNEVCGGSQSSVGVSGSSNTGFNLDVFEQLIDNQE
jgi:hypothetical protein